MDRLGSDFERKSRKASPSRPTRTIDGSQRSDKTTPEPASPRRPLHVPPTPNNVKETPPSLSLRELNLSNKRTRSLTTGSLPCSHIGATHICDGLDNTQTTSATVEGDSRDSHPQLQDILQHTESDSARGQTPKMPSFLALPPQEIVAKFQRIVWMECNRIVQSLTDSSPAFKWARVTGDHLKILDRYINIQPWENNRVRLRVPSGKVDYVNASPITLSSTMPLSAARRKGQGQSNEDTAILGMSDPEVGGPERYIAMQGPKRNTTDHVWRMVVEQLESPAVVVMLTETHEANMEKCYPYFPRSPGDAPLEINERDEFGDAFRATVHCEAIEETKAGDAIELRKLVIRSYKSPSKATKTRSNDERYSPTTPVDAVDGSGDIKMLSPLKNAPDDLTEEDGSDDKCVKIELGESTTAHRKELRRETPAPRTPRIVHCSAGVGRSGTFIALEHLMRELDAGVLENWDSPSHFRHRTDEGGSANTEGDSHNGHHPSDHDSDVKMDVEEQPAALAEPERNDLIFRTVNQLREQRRSMVQAEPQFLFIYEVMRKLWVDRYGSAMSPSAFAGPPPRLNGPDDAEGEESDIGQPARKRQELDPLLGAR
ncbi:protein-tyrosine phosphatase-like protein [Diaporthe sp. PMI_573]|nr:protein-tyrosine phosphatase-like protein [Diaporthaceae sp. PMI_573]